MMMRCGLADLDCTSLALGFVCANIVNAKAMIHSTAIARIAKNLRLIFFSLFELIQRTYCAFDNAETCITEDRNHPQRRIRRASQCQSVIDRSGDSETRLSEMCDSIASPQLQKEGEIKKRGKLHHSAACPAREPAE